MHHRALQYKRGKSSDRLVLHFTQYVLIVLPATVCTRQILAPISIQREAPRVKRSPLCGQWQSITKRVNLPYTHEPARTRTALKISIQGATWISCCGEATRRRGSVQRVITSSLRRPRINHSYKMNILLEQIGIEAAPRLGALGTNVIGYVWMAKRKQRRILNVFDEAALFA